MGMIKEIRPQLTVKALEAIEKDFQRILQGINTPDKAALVMNFEKIYYPLLSRIERGERIYAINERAL